MRQTRALPASQTNPNSSELSAFTYQPSALAVAQSALKAESWRLKAALTQP
jgi:hypothetical protein